MIPVLLVEDDVEMLAALVKMIAWHEAGFSIVGKATNGREGLELIRSTHPRLLISDISMPQMDGLRMVRTAREEGHDFQTIILTCHEEFDYAREAINLEVVDYLVKITLTEEELLESVLRAAERLKRNPEERFLKTERLFLPYLRDQIDGDELKQSLQESGEKLPPPGVRILQLYIDNFEYRRISGELSPPNQLRSDMIKSLERLTLIGIEFLPVSSDDGVLTLLVWGEKKGTIGNNLDELEKFVEELGKLSGETISGVVSPPLDDLGSLVDGIHEMQTYRHRLFYSRRSGLIRGDRGDRRFSRSRIDEEALYESLEKPLTTLRREESAEAATRIVQTFSSLSDEPAVAVRFFGELQRLVERTAERLGIVLPSLPQNTDRLQAAEELLSTTIATFFQTAEEQGLLSTRSGINAVIRYMRENLYEDLTCADMAAKAAMSTSHFSRTFKKETGESYSQFLTKLRIHRADELLQGSDLPVEAIAAEVGFENTSYFYRVYKKVTGRTPGERRC